VSARVPAADGSIAGIGSIADAATRLRRTFDAGFAAPPPAAPERRHDFIAIGVGASSYALRLAEIASLHKDLPILPVPTPRAELLGIVGLRGVLAPMYDLAALLRHARATRPRWMIFVRAPELVGFAFETFETQLRLPQSACMAAERGEREAADTGRAARPVGGALQAGGVIRPIIQLASLVAALKGENSDG
jgi:chemotaxis signal transduction protein